jgi:hypothetical protein
MTAFLVKDLEGKGTSLSDIAKNKPILFIFVRHFG